MSVGGEGGRLSSSLSFVAGAGRCGIRWCLAGNLVGLWVERKGSHKLLGALARDYLLLSQVALMSLGFLLRRRRRPTKESNCL